jgi:hypothetical protein
MINKKLYKIVFLAISVIWLIVSRVFISDKFSIEYWIMTTVIYSIGIHWIYAYVFEVDMHNHLGKIKPNENKTTRFLSCLFGGAICIFITFYI